MWQFRPLCCSTSCQRAYRPLCCSTSCQRAYRPADDCSADDLTSAGVMAELNRLFGSPAPGQGIVVCYSGHCSETGAWALQSKAAESLTPAQLLKAWSASAAFKAGGSLFVLLNCCHSGIWAVAARAREACGYSARLPASRGLSTAHSLRCGSSSLSAVSALRSCKSRLQPTAYVPEREGCTVLIGPEELTGTPIAMLLAKRSGTERIESLILHTSRSVDHRALSHPSQDM
jgi:hypothetical protein